MSEPRTTNHFAPDGRSAERQPKWRQDFPIDVADDEYGARRDFTKFMVLVSAAFAVGQIWIGALNRFRRGRAQPGPSPIAEVADLPVGGALQFAYPTPDDPCILIRTGEGEFQAYGSQCTHLMCAVLPAVEQQQLLCPCHRGCFDLLSGRPLAGPPRRPLPRVRLHVDGTTIYATGVELRTV